VWVQAIHVVGDGVRHFGDGCHFRSVVFKRAIHVKGHGEEQAPRNTRRVQQQGRELPQSKLFHKDLAGSRTKDDSHRAADRRETDAEHRLHTGWSRQFALTTLKFEVLLEKCSANWDSVDEKFCHFGRFGLYSANRTFFVPGDVIAAS
jgi:hypothetical protein